MAGKYRISSQDMIAFLEQFALLMAAGVPLIRACDTLEKNQKRLAARILIYSLKRDLQAGHSLFQSFKQTSHFDRMTCYLIKLGEKTGKITDSLNAIVTHHQQRRQRRKKLQQIMLYPTLLLISALILAVGLLFFVIPEFAQLFENTQVKLPLPSRIIFSIAHHKQLVLFIGIFFIFFLSLSYKTFAAKLPWQHFPVVKIYYQHYFLSKMCRTLGLCLQHGLSLPLSLELAFEANPTRQIQSIQQQLQQHLASGMHLYQALSLCHYFPDFLIQMVKVGEETANMPTLLHKAASYYENELDHQLQQLSTLLEPLIIGILGVVIGGLVLSMYLPILKLGNTL